jgi:hypothetical protein
MLPSFSRGLRFALVLALSVSYVAWHGRSQVAHAQDDGEDEDEDDDDGGSGGKDDLSEDEGEDDKDQPLVTAGGLFTLATYPVNELLRPLTMTQQITQLRLAGGTDVSDKGAFESAGVSLEAIHGATDNVTIIGGLTSAYNFKQFGLYAGLEGALAYDLLDFRIAGNLHRAAIARQCGQEMPIPDNCKDAAGMTLNVPSGKYDAGKTKFSIDLGFPFRYAIKPEIAIIALQTLISIDFDSKPDLNPSVGIATNPIPQLSLVAFAQLQIPNFDTSAGNFKVPVTGRVQFSPNQKLDLGLEFVLLNVKPTEGISPIAARFLSLFVQARFGK